MKFSLVKESLLDTLTDINAIVDRKTTSPIISHAHITAKNGQLLLRGTDTEVTLAASVPASIEEEGEITVPAGKFLDVVKHMPSGMFVNCHLDGEQFCIQSGNSRFKLTTLPAEDFPVLEEIDANDAIQINSVRLNQTMQKVKFSMAVQDVRYFLNGMYLRTLGEGNGLHAVSTDGHRLSCALTQMDNVSEESRGIILPKKAVNELIKLTGRFDQSLTLHLSDRHLNLQLANYNFTTNLIDGQFPNYEQVIPDYQQHPVIIARQAFLEALQRAKVLLIDRHDGIRLTFDSHQLSLAARNQDNETANETLEIINSRDDVIEAGFNINYLIDAVSNLEGENIQMHFEDGESPCLVTSKEDNNIRYVIMPMRL
ncbi:DNA polymerase III subunit beta [Cardiobacteriaceae bacterium TAE3-ERU3]|nr:DNA polymerase III subunit beta [Cardiobacteriaceae bacterium TAE3-ERU3]